MLIYLSLTRGQTHARDVLADDSRRALGFGQVLAGKPREALATLQESAAFARQIENLWGEAECSWKLAYTWLELGDYGKAIGLAREGIQLTDKLGLQPMTSLALSVWGTVQRTLMVLDGVRETFLEELINSEAQHLIEVVLDWILAELCAVHALAGDWRQAHESARQGLQVRGDESLLPMGLCGWYETEAFLRGGDGDLARAEVEQLAGIVGSNRRYQLILLRSRAVLAQWDGDVVQAIAHLEAALALAQKIGLPGEEWPILGALGELYLQQGNEEMAQEAYQKAATIINRLARTVDDEDLRAGFFAADPARSVLEQGEKVLR
ncbi:MAG: tetratricopeptide repeat protein [Candidatus Promineifilaceae bacterium]|nr:tetratricopeptide repeat protein [Candidatus Promineifilaceae bacterium]